MRQIKNKGWALIILGLVLVLNQFILTTTANAQALQEVNKITYGSSEYPEIFNDKIVYQDIRDGIDWNIYMFDVSEQRETQITFDNSNYWPTIDDKYIVWINQSYNEISGFFQTLCIYNIASGSEIKRIPIAPNFRITPPKLNNNRLIFTEIDELSQIYRIALYDIKTGDKTYLSEDIYLNHDPLLYDNNAVWRRDYFTEEGQDVYEIVHYDLFTQKTRVIYTGSVYKYANPQSLYQDKVVWIESEIIDQNYDIPPKNYIYIYDLTKDTLTNVCQDTIGYKEHVVLTEDKVLWRDERNDQGNIYMYNLKTSEETPLITGPGRQRGAHLFNNVLVWEERFDDLEVPAWSIYYAKLSPEPDTTPPTVTASPAGRTYSSTQTVTITADEPADIYYTVDGSDPTTASTLYTGPITINSTTILKFMAVDRAGNQSTISTTNYIIQYPTQLAYTGLLSAAKDSTVTISANLTAANGGPSDLSGREIIFTLGSQTVSAFTDAAGNATAALTLNQAAGNYPLTAVYKGDAALLGSTYAGTFYITAGNSNNVKPNVSIDPVVITPDANGQTYTATIIGTVDQGAAVEVSVSINHGTAVVYQAVVNGTTWSYTIANLAKNDQVKLEAIAKDVVGNTSLPAKDNFKVR